MSFISDFADGATELPRSIAGGLATALGADGASTKEFLGLKPEHEQTIAGAHNYVVENNTGILDEISNHPGKFLGEMALYSFLPLRIFGKTAKLAGKYGKVKDIANQSLSFGTYGAIGEVATATLNDRDAHPIEQFALNAIFTAATFGAIKAAAVGASHIKNKAVKSKYIRDYLTDVGMPQHEAKVAASMSDADMAQAIGSLNQHLNNVGNAIRATADNVQPSLEIIGGKVLAGEVKDAHKEISKTILKTGFVSQAKRPVTKIADHKNNIAKEARPSVEKIRNAADDVDANVNILDNHAFNLAASIKETIPSLERRQAISASLDVRGTQTGLSPIEIQVANSVRATFDDMGKTLVQAGVIKHFKESYIPHLLRDAKRGDMSFIDKLLNDSELRSSSSAFSTRAMERESKKALAERDYLTTDIAELAQLYVINVGRATANKNLMKAVDLKMIKHTPLDGYVKITAETHPNIITKVVKSHHAGILSDLAMRVKGNPDGSKDVLDLFNTLKDSEVAYVHPDYIPSLNLLAKQVDLSTASKAVIALNFAMKRILIMGSLFHFNAIAESIVFAGAGGFGAVAKGAGAGFLITGGNPLGAAVGAGIGAGAHVLLRTKNIIGAMRGGKYGDQYDYALRYVSVRPPRDIGNDETYAALHAVQSTIDKYVPSGMVKGALKKGASGINGINKSIDMLMWHRLLAGAKMQTFYAKLEELTLMNSKLSEKRSQHELAKIAGQFTNDAYGGQNWRKLAENVDNKWGRKIAASMASPLGMTRLNLAFFAPDWTTSNIRVLAKSFPGIEKDPLARKLYQKYAMRAAMYYMIVGSSVQMALTGKPIFMNDDPLKYDLGDGRSMTFSKQLSEPFSWISNPMHEAHVKTSSLVKLVEEQVANKPFVGSNGSISNDDDTAFEMIGKRLNIAGKHFAPIFVQDIGRNGPEGVYGFFGHPVYGHIRHGFKQPSSDIGEL